MTVSTVAPPYGAVDLLPAGSRGGGDAVAGVLTAVFVMLLGPAVGLVWAAVAPKLSISALAAGSDATFRAQVGADAWFLLVGALAGVLCAVLAIVMVGEPGPAVTAGLGVGGLAAAFIADRVGYLSERGATHDALRALGAHPDGALISEIDFRIRALGVLTAWPIAALAIVGLAIAINASRR